LRLCKNPPQQESRFNLLATLFSRAPKPGTIRWNKLLPQQLAKPFSRGNISPISFVVHTSSRSEAKLGSASEILVNIRFPIAGSVSATVHPRQSGLGTFGIVRNRQDQSRKRIWPKRLFCRTRDKRTSAADAEARITRLCKVSLPFQFQAERIRISLPFREMPVLAPNVIDKWLRQATGDAKTPSVLFILESK
jgi:hypothetical protein